METERSVVKICMRYHLLRVIAAVLSLVHTRVGRKRAGRCRAMAAQIVVFAGQGGKLWHYNDMKACSEQQPSLQRLDSVATISVLLCFLQVCHAVHAMSPPPKN